MGEIGNAKLTQGHDIGGVGLYRMGQQIGPCMNGLGGLIDTHHVMAKACQRARHRAAKAPKPDDHHTVAFGERKLL